VIWKSDRNYQEVLCNTDSYEEGAAICIILTFLDEMKEVGSLLQRKRHVNAMNVVL